MSIFVFCICYIVMAFNAWFILVWNVYGNIPLKDVDTDDKYFEMICSISILWPVSLLAGFILLPIILIAIGLGYIIRFIKKLIKNK